jgi:leucyl aminopeptidase
MSKYTNILKTDKYIHLDNILNYSIGVKNINTVYSTTCVIINYLYITKKGDSEGAAFFINEIETIIKLYNSMNKITPALIKLLTDLWNNIKNRNIQESVITLELLDSSKGTSKDAIKSFKTLVITIVNDNNNINYDDTNSRYVINENLRACGSHIRHSLKKNMLGGCNLIFLGLDNNDITYLLEGFVLSMYQFNKYKTNVMDNTINKHPYIQQNNNKYINITHTKKKLSASSTISNKTKAKKPTYKSIINNKGGGTSTTNNHNNHNNNTFELHICIMNKTNNSKQLKSLLDDMLVITKSIHICQDLINEPGNKVNPHSLVQFISKFIETHKLPLKMKVINETELKGLGMNLLVSVGQGSIEKMRSRLVVLEYIGNKNTNKINTVLIGKGITQDIGGISIKSGDSIPEMKTDKSGACIVFALLGAISRLGRKHNIIGLLPIAENSIGPNATIPGDIIKAYNGINVEIIDTDAEGRLMIADCLSYAQDKWKDATYIDISTLTSEQEYVSCKEFSTIIGLNTDKTINNIIKNGELIGERIVKFPFIRGIMEKDLISNTADIRNISKDCKGDIYPSTTFLAHFINGRNPNTKWIHIDLGGNTYKTERGYNYEGVEAVGIGIKMLEGLFN